MSAEHVRLNVVACAPYTPHDWLGCPVDGRTCEVINLFLRPLPIIDDSGPESLGIRPTADALRAARPYLPCDRCRLVEKQGGNLVKIRFGKHERRVLMRSPG